MKKDVTIKIKGVQKYSKEERVETVTETSAEYYFRNGGHFVKFEEEAEGFTETSKCLLKARDGIVEMTKNGLVDSHMIFEKDKIHMTQYETPYGELLVGVYTKDMKVDVTDDLIQVSIAYALDANGEKVADCNILVNIKANGKEKDRSE